MRTTFSLGACAAALLALGWAACRTPPLLVPITDDFGTHPAPTGDMAVHGFVDLSAPGGLGCAALVDCLNNCFDQQCQTDCYNVASFSAQNVLSDALNCIYGFCLDSDGKRPPRCIQGADGNFDDPTDGGIGECNDCLQNAYALVGGYQCQPANSPDCNPADCQGAVKTCLSQ